MNTMKVLMLVPNLRVSNGVASFAMNYFRRLDHAAVRMDFALCRDIDTPYYEEVKQAGGRIFILPPVKNIGKHLAACRKILRDGHYDVVHDNSLLVTLPMMLCAKAAGVKVRLLHSHNARLGETAKKERRNKLLAPLLVYAATDYAACSGEAARALLGDRPYRFIPNVISAGRIVFSKEKRTEVRRAMGVEDKIVIATVGRAAPQKNPLFALDVIRALSASVPNLAYWWIGSGPMNSQLQDAVKERGLEKTAFVLGSREDVPELYQAADIFFLPSLFEGLPVTGVEAQAAGLPCVLSDTITREVVFTDLVRYLPLDAPLETWTQALRDQITRIPERRSHRAELENSPFSDQNAGRHLEAIYRELLAEKD